MSKHIVILGAGYGGLLAALNVRKFYSKAEATVTVINKYPTHQIITELHRLAAGNVSEKAVTHKQEQISLACRKGKLLAEINLQMLGFQREELVDGEGLLACPAPPFPPSSEIGRAHV